MQLTLTARQPFNFHSVVHSHGWMQLAPFRYDETARTLSYVDRLANGRVVDYSISEAPKGVNVDTSGRLSKAEQGEVIGKVEWMLALDQDFSAFYKAARQEPKLRHAKKLARGRVLRSPTFFEDVLKTILTTNTLWAATKRMNLNLIAAFGDPLLTPPAGSDAPKAFPTPAKIAAASPDVLRTAVRVGYRAPAIHELSSCARNC
jgi:3-methyladenine DNA glycosylase/8-oxoguanine DNA glycosylase